VGRTSQTLRLLIRATGAPMTPLHGQRESPKSPTAPPRGLPTPRQARRVQRLPKIIEANASSVGAIGLTASCRFEPDSGLVTVAELDSCRLQRSS
jgi:hypothetical protein